MILNPAELFINILYNVLLYPKEKALHQIKLWSILWFCSKLSKTDRETSFKCQDHEPNWKIIKNLFFVSTYAPRGSLALNLIVIRW